jgi:hypothetical protein
LAPLLPEKIAETEGGKRSVKAFGAREKDLKKI